LRSGRKGISEIVAALILVLIVMAGAIIVYVYSSGLLGSLQGAQPQQPYSNKIVLEYYNWTKYSNPDTLVLSLRNVGSGRGILTDFFVGNGTFSTSLGQVTLTGGTCTTLSPLNPQSACSAILTIPSSVKITPHTAYNVKIVTKDGSVFTYSCIAGQSTGS